MTSMSFPQEDPVRALRMLIPGLDGGFQVLGVFPERKEAIKSDPKDFGFFHCGNFLSSYFNPKFYTYFIGDGSENCADDFDGEMNKLRLMNQVSRTER